ncbi:SDR family NAD(P)-dependent oxidoreductase [Planctobacterium marinum]|uniref:Short-chain dehydrogenase n=1 Tax=Planctobacterium marinum TaxID=1631968 RepID=A0AA48HPD6_9ALTE|nr:short-chain dehydrogenase [Planctobacterium marinum]
MKQILITGASSGIGEQLAKDYANQGWRVYACGRNSEKLQALQNKTSNLQALAFDVTEPEQIVQAASQIEGQLDLLLLNAGNCEYIDDPLHFDGALFERVIKVNLVAIGYCLETLLPKVRSGGQLAIVSSSAAYLPFPRASAYGTSKAGASYLAKTLAIELKPHNIDVSLISPGFVKTPLTDKNDFEMPMQVSVDFASNAIIKGLAKRKSEVHFPSRFTFFLKLLAALPAPIWKSIARKMLPSAQPQS